MNTQEFDSVFDFEKFDDWLNNIKNLNYCETQIHESEQMDSTFIFSSTYNQ